MNLTVYFDGGYRPCGDPTRVRWGFVCYDAVGVLQHYDAGRARPACRSSTVAECLALEKAMEWARAEHSSKSVTFIGDSADIIRLMRGESQSRSKTLRKASQRLLALCEGCKYWAFDWVPREANSAAHRLAQMGKRPAWLP